MFRCARQVADRVVFMDAGEIVEINEPDAFFDDPREARAQRFLSQVLHTRSLSGAT